MLITFRYHFTFQGVSNTVQTASSIVFCVIFAFAPLVAFVSITLNFKKLSDMDEISKTGVFYESLDLSKGRIVLIKPIFYLIRRLVLAASIILLDHFSI